jgi:hypothetical protein
MPAPLVFYSTSSSSLLILLLWTPSRDDGLDEMAPVSLNSSALARGNLTYRSPHLADRGEGVVVHEHTSHSPNTRSPEIVGIPEVTHFGSFDTESSARGPQTSLVQVI